MYNFVPTLLLATFVVAESSVTVFDFYSWPPETLTLRGSDSTATTYLATACDTDSPTPSDATFAARALTTPASAPVSTPEALLPRAHHFGVDNNESTDPCFSYTIVQGPSTYELHNTAASISSAVDWACTWTGEWTAADITCNETTSGSSPRTTINDVISQTDLAYYEIYITADVVTALTSSASASASASANSTATVESTTGSNATTTTGASSSGTGTGSAKETKKSTGLAVAGSMPTGAMVLAGGAAGIFAAALAL